MRNKKPPFEITNQIIDHVAEIAELMGRLTAASPLSANPTLRRANRIRTNKSYTPPRQSYPNHTRITCY